MDTGDSAEDRTDLVAGEEEGSLRSSTWKTQATLEELDASIRATKPCAKKRDPNRDSSKWRAWVMGLTFGKQSRLLRLLWEYQPTTNHKTKRGETEAALSQGRYPAPSPCHLPWSMLVS